MAGEHIFCHPHNTLNMQCVYNSSYARKGNRRHLNLHFLCNTFEKQTNKDGSWKFTRQDESHFAFKGWQRLKAHSFEDEEEDSVKAGEDDSDFTKENEDDFAEDGDDIAEGDGDDFAEEDDEDFAEDIDDLAKEDADNSNDDVNGRWLEFWHEFIWFNS